MGFWLNAWAGDGAGSVEGREPYRALISLTHTDGDFPAAIHQSETFDGTNWYYNISATCLTPNSLPAIVTKVEDVGDYVWSLELTPWDWGDSQKQPWRAGVHLFSIMMYGPGGDQSGTIATVIVPARARKALTLTEHARQQLVRSRGFAYASSR